MKYTIDDLRRFFPHPNVQAFYQVMRFKESSLYDSAYRMVNGAPPITDFSRHPYEGLKTTEGGRAAGASQFIPTTWGGLEKKYGFPSFEPHYQDLGYVGCLIERNALELVMEGRFDEAVAACRLEWSSLPGAAESRATWTMDKARDLYMRAGGSLKDVTGTPYEPVPVEPERKPVDPLSAIALFGPLIANLIPQVAKLFDKKVGAPGKIEAAQKVIETIVTSTGSVNEQQALQKIASDPVMLQTATKAIMTEPTIMGMLEVGGGIKAAREANLAVQVADKPFWYNPAFWMSLALLPLVYWIVGSVLVGGINLGPDDAGFWKIFGTAFDQETRSGTVNLVIGMVLGGIVGIWFGTSYGSMRKTEIAAEASQRTEK